MKKLWLISLWITSAFMISCGAKSTGTAADEATATEEVQTPVTITNISNEPLTEYVELNAMSSFLQSSFIKSTATGYIKSSFVKPGQFMRAGQLAFLMQTKEARALGNTINILDSSFRFS